MTFRRNVRKAIQRGSSVYATVESYRLGWATVRLSTNGARLTNLSTQGAVVKEGDNVIVDYSAGVKPVVRPLFIPEYEPEELPEAVPAEVTYPDDDWSCLVGVDYADGWGLDPDGNIPADSYDCWFQFIKAETWTRIRWADNYWYAPWGPNGIYGDTTELWDTAEGALGMYDETYNYGQDYITITRTGRYYIHARCEFDDVDGNRTTGVPIEPTGTGYDYTWYLGDYPTNPTTGEPRTPYNHDGHYALRITKNDIPVAMGTWRTMDNNHWTQGGLDGPYVTLNAIVWCEFGDIIAVELWENNNGPYMNPGWGYPMSGTQWGNMLSATLIPGTERAVYQATSSISAYIFADSRNVPAYTLGTYDGWTFRQSAYTRGGAEAGGQDIQGDPKQGSYIHSYTEGYLTGGSSSIHAYLEGEPFV